MESRIKKDRFCVILSRVSRGKERFVRRILSSSIFFSSFFFCFVISASIVCCIAYIDPRYIYGREKLYEGMDKSTFSFFLSCYFRRSRKCLHFPLLADDRYIDTEDSRHGYRWE